MGADNWGFVIGMCFFALVSTALALGSSYATYCSAMVDGGNIVMVFILGLLAVACILMMMFCWGLVVMAVKEVLE